MQHVLPGEAPTAAMLLGSLFLMVAGCSEQMIHAPQDVSVQHAAGQSKKGDGAGVAYDVVTLGTLGGNSGLAQAINNAAVVAGEATNAAGQRRAFVWTEAAGMRDLLGSDYGQFNWARDINGRGEIAGVEANGFVYDLATDQVAWLPPLPAHTGTQAIAINADGTVVGRSFGQSADSDWRTVVWNPGAAGGYSEPFDLDCPAMQLYPAINSDGDIVANECRGHYSPPYLWTRNGDGYDNPIALGTLGGSGSTHATGIDDRGRVAGWSTAPGGARRAVLWHPNDYAAPIDLGGAALVVAMSNHNVIVGEIATRNGRTAVRWTVDDAGSLTAVQELAAPGGYANSAAAGINDEGWIVGSAWNRKGRVAVLWRPR
jgi:probable HAF family extracellular repeat protein